MPETVDIAEGYKNLRIIKINWSRKCLKWNFLSPDSVFMLSCENNVRLFNLVVYVVDNLYPYIPYSFLLKEMYVAHEKELEGPFFTHSINRLTRSLEKKEIEIHHTKLS